MSPRPDLRSGLKLVAKRLARKDAAGALAVIRALVHIEARPRPRPAPTAQLTLLGLEPDDLVPCAKLHARAMPARVCVMRQQISDVQRRSHDADDRNRNRQRGTASDYPHCVTETCAQGRHRRAILDPMCQPWEGGAGPGKRFQRNRRQDEQEAARARLAAIGLLDTVPTLDGLDRAVEPEGEGT